MTGRVLALFGVATVAVAAATALVFELPLANVVVLAPVIVLTAAALLGLTVLWVRVGLESLRRSRHPRRVVAVALGSLALLVALTLLGVELPRE